jgi:hypothetical protein
MGLLRMRRTKFDVVSEEELPIGNSGSVDVEGQNIGALLVGGLIWSETFRMQDY